MLDWASPATPEKVLEHVVARCSHIIVLPYTAVVVEDVRAPPRSVALEVERTRFLLRGL